MLSMKDLASSSENSNFQKKLLKPCKNFTCKNVKKFHPLNSYHIFLLEIQYVIDFRRSGGLINRF